MKKLPLCISICAAAFIIGCGEVTGGNSDDTNASASVSVSGQTTDEILVNADVTVYAKNVGGDVLAKTTTDENGKYNISLKNYTGPVLVEVKCNDNSRLKDFNGNDLGKCNLTVPIYSAGVIGDDNNLNIAVTPYTTAMTYVATGGNLDQTIDAEELKKAKIAVAKAYNLNIDLVSINPSDSVIYKTQILAFDSIGKNHNEIIEQMIDDAKDGIIGDDLNDTLKSALNVKVISLNDVNVNNPDFNEDPISVAKDTVNLLRTTVNNIFNDDKKTGDVYKEIKKVNDDFEKITVDVNLAVNPLVEIVNLIANKESSKETDDMNISVDSDDNKTFNYTITKDDVEYKGKIVFNTDIYEDINFSKDFDYTLSIEDAEFPYNDENSDKKQYLNAKADLKNAPSNKKLYLTLNNVSLNSDEVTLNIDEINASLVYEPKDDENITPKYVKIDTIKLSGNVLNKYNADLTIDIPSYTSTNSDAEFIIKGIEGEVHCVDDNGNILNVKPDGNVKYKAKDGSLITLPIEDSWDNGYWFDGLIKDSQYNGIDDDNFDLSDVNCSEGHPKITERDTYDDLGNSGIVPDEIVLKGDVKDLDNNMELNGNIDAKSDDIKEINITKDNQYFTVETTGDILLKRPEYADTKLHIYGKYRSEEDPRELEVNFKYGTYDYIDVITNWEAGKKSGEIKINALNGFKTTIPINENGDPDFSNPIPVYVNGEKVGELEKNDDMYRIKYTDGTFESLQ